ncbi:hypothetical protein B0H65DRAFT_512672 [Neurospora tetraspora]|uniref:Uncharacterized protein n=1 Tax=Neurospora tetraspora TaxID=94610 RepID=A0AAE0J1Z4_9PEZI|nr:hypothetical protein B0H65DRAFT_512672 [Neurospora tetraspora]
MHPQLLFSLLLTVLLGASMAFVLPKWKPNPRLTPELINVGSSSNTHPVSTAVYLPHQISPHVQTARTAPLHVKLSGQAFPNNKREEAEGTHFKHDTEARSARDSIEGHGRIYRRDGGGSNNTIIYIIAAILSVFFLIGGVIIWRKFQGH